MYRLVRWGASFESTGEIVERLEGDIDLSGLGNDRLDHVESLGFSELEDVERATGRGVGQLEMFDLMLKKLLRGKGDEGRVGQWLLGMTEVLFGSLVDGVC